MSQKVSSLLLNNYIYNSSNWFAKNHTKFSLNEDLQIREIINIIFKMNTNKQFFFIDKIVLYKYATKLRIYIYFFCNFAYLKQNLSFNSSTNSNYINTFYLYYKYQEILNIKKIEILKILRVCISSSVNLQIFLKNLNKNFNTKNLLVNKYLPLVSFKTYSLNLLKANYTFKFNFLKQTNRIKTNHYNVVLKTNEKKIRKFRYTKFNRYSMLKYYKSLRFILYYLCYNDKFLARLNIESLIRIIYYELSSLDNTSKSYNFLFYNLFNILREQLNLYFKDENCKVKGLRIQIKGRYFLTKRKRIFIFNFGNLNLNEIRFAKDYANLNLVKSTGSSSIKVWINYKN